MDGGAKCRMETGSELSFMCGSETPGSETSCTGLQQHQERRQENTTFPFSKVKDEDLGKVVKSVAPLQTELQALKRTIRKERKVCEQLTFKENESNKTISLLKTSTENLKELNSKLITDMSENRAGNAALLKENQDLKVEMCSVEMDKSDFLDDLRTLNLALKSQKLFRANEVKWLSDTNDKLETEIEDLKYKLASKRCMFVQSTVPFQLPNARRKRPKQSKQYNSSGLPSNTIFSVFN